MALAPATALDAETARATIEEFEAAVDQALRDSARDINQLIDSSDRAGSAGPTGFDDEKGARP